MFFFLMYQMQSPLSGYVYIGGTTRGKNREMRTNILAYLYERIEKKRKKQKGNNPCR